MNRPTVITLLFVVPCAIALLWATMTYVRKDKKDKANEDVEKYENDTPLFEIVYLYSDTCPYCHTFQPVFDKVTQALVHSPASDRINLSISKLEKKDMNNKEYQSLVSGFPTVLIYKNDRYVDKIVGSTDEAGLMRKLQTMLQL